MLRPLISCAWRRPLGALAVVLATLVGGCGSHTPTSPSGGASSFVAGAWAGSYIPVCPASSTCGSVGAAPTGTQALSLILTQAGTAISGQINLSGWLPRVADVTGTIAPDGTMSLQGGSSWPAGEFCQPAGGWDLASWNGRYDFRTDTITGAFSYVTQKHLSSCYYTQNLMVNATSLALDRRKVPNTPFAGHWQGTYVVRSCTPVGWRECYPQRIGDERPFDLILTQHGNSVTGTLASFSVFGREGVPVSGTVGADGVSLTLHASQSWPVSGATEVFRITAWSTTRDAIGRMQGSFSFIYEVHWNVGVNNGSVWSSSYDADLRSVVLVPWQ